MHVSANRTDFRGEGRGKTAVAAAAAGGQAELAEKAGGRWGKDMPAWGSPAKGAGEPRKPGNSRRRVYGGLLKYAMSGHYRKAGR